MATIRKHRGKYQVRIRRTGFPPVSKAFDVTANELVSYETIVAVAIPGLERVVARGGHFVGADLTILVAVGLHESVVLGESGVDGLY